MAPSNRDREFSPFPVVLGHAVKENDEPDCESLFQSNDWTALYEILDIKILHLDTKDSVEVYGRIIFHSSTGFVFLLNRQKSDPETVNLPGGAITLTNPKIGVSGWDRAGISFELGGDLEELNEEFLDWTPNHLPFNTVLTAEFEGRNCSLSVRYIVFSHALVANLEITLLREEEEEESNNATIFGEITASYSEWPGLAFTLFDKKCEECVSVSEKRVIPLSKSVIAVPRGSEFEITVNLPVAGGKVRFCPRGLGDYVGIISDEIQVKVTFCDWRHHPETRIAYDNFKMYNEWSSDEEEGEKEI